jgi:hypothetical protein
MGKVETLVKRRGDSCVMDPVPDAKVRILIPHAVAHGYSDVFFLIGVSEYDIMTAILPKRRVHCTSSSSDGLSEERINRQQKLADAEEKLRNWKPLGMIMEKLDRVSTCNTTSFFSSFRTTNVSRS